MLTAKRTQRTMVLIAFAMISLLVIGCAAKTTSIGVSPEKLGEIGGQIDQNPDQMDRILSRHGLTEAEFERAVREVSSDREMSRRYHRSFKKASGS